MPVTVVRTSFATVAIETFITELSRVMRNCPAASVMRTRPAPAARADGAAVAWADSIAPVSPPRRTWSSPEPEERPLEQRGDRGQRPRPRALLEPGQATSRPGARDGRRREPLLELRRDGLGANEEVDLEEALQAPRLEIAGAGEQLLAVSNECLCVQHLRVLVDRDAAVQKVRV